MKKFLIILLILCVFAFSACSNNSGENSSNSIEDLPQPTLPSSSSSIVEDFSKTDYNIVITETTRYLNGKISNEDGQYFFMNIQKNVRLPIQSNSCSIYMCIKAGESGGYTVILKEETTIDSLRNEMPVKAQIKVKTTTQGNALIQTEYLEVLSIDVSE